MDRHKKQEVVERLHRLPRLSFGFYPTPIEEMPRLRAALGGGPQLFIKRDDYTGVCFGGNKARELEYLLAQALAEGAEVVITSGVEKSNLARLTAAMCARVGLRCIVVISPAQHPDFATPVTPASLYLCKMLGAEVHCVGSHEERLAWVPDLTDKLRAEGRKVFEIPLGAAAAYGALGFVEAANETAGQLRAMGLQISHVFQASLTGGTQAGLAVGCRLFGLKRVRVIGVSPDDPAPVVASEVERLMREVGDLLEFPAYEIADEINDLIILDSYVGPGYGIGTPESEEALNLLARTEGILLDPVYTAKAMAAMIDWVRKGKLTEEDAVLFWHTGGQMALLYVPG